jgi:hypothetical protein
VDFFEFESLFKAKLSKLRLPADAEMQEPEVRATAPPLAWQIEFFVTFSDGTYIRIWEMYDKFAGLYASRKTQWAYHYGSPQRKNANGEMTWEPDDPVVIRIDTCSGLHLHYKARDPHYPQSAIKGAKLADVDCWQFIKNIVKYRQAKQEVLTVFGFKI